MEIDDVDLKIQSENKRKLNKHSSQTHNQTPMLDTASVLWTLARRAAEARLEREAQNGPVRVYMKDGQRV